MIVARLTAWRAWLDMPFALSSRRAYTALAQLPRTWSMCDEVDRSLEKTTPRILSWSTHSIPIRGGLGDRHLPPPVTSSSLDLVTLSRRLMNCALDTPRVTNGRVDKWTDGRTDGRTDGWTDGRRNGWMDGWMDGWMEGGRDGGID